MNRCYVRAVLICLFTSLLALPIHATEYRVFTEQMPPYNYQSSEGAVIGFSTDVVREMLRRSNIKIHRDITIVPWARAYNILENQDQIMLFSMTRSAAREPLFQWVGPIAQRTIWLWKLSERDDIEATTLEQAKGYVVGGVYEFASSKYLEKQGFHVELVPTIEQNWKKLFLHRIDMVSALELEAAYSMRQYGRNINQLEKVAIVDKRYEYYLALSRNSPVSDIKRLQSALDEMKADGTYQKFHKAYLH